MHQNYYDLCCQHRGKVVNIVEKCGRMHSGEIIDVDKTYVYIKPVQGGLEGYRYGFGPGFGAGGFGPGFGAGGFGHGFGAGGFGPGYGAGGFAPGYGAGFGPGYGAGGIIPIALAGIGGFALGSAFNWW